MMASIEIANVARVVALAAADAWQPPPPIDYLAWAESNVVFSRRESEFAGPYNRRNFPLNDEILQALSPEDPCRIVTVTGSAQGGKTVIGNVFVGGTMDMDPTDLLVTHPTEDNARRWSKLKLKPMLRGTESLKEKFPERSRDGSDSVLMKEHRDGLGAIVISGANSPATLSQVTMKRQVQDDLAKWETNIAGDPETQADARSDSVEFAKILKLGTPLVMPGCRITKSYRAGSQELPFVPCPHCDHMQVLEWENMLAALDPDRPEEAHFTCVSCDAAIEEYHRTEILARVEWRAQNPKAKTFHRSFWSWAAYSPLRSWERIARAWLGVKGDSAGEQAFWNDTVGKAWETQGAAPPWEVLRDRAEKSAYARGTIPAGGLLVFVGIDCQGDRVEWHAVAAGRDYRRYVVDYGVIPGHISEDATRERLDALMLQTWPNAAGHRLGVERAGIDGNAWTEDVWGWARRHLPRKVIMVRGSPSENAPRIAKVKKERNERTGALLKYAGRFYNFGASVMKMALYRDLAKEDPETKGYVSFPRGLEDEYFRQLTAERRTPILKKRHGFTLWRWTKDAAQANEALDTFLQAETAATNFGVRGMPDAMWDRIAGQREQAPPTPAPEQAQTLEPETTKPAPPAPTVPPVRSRRRSIFRFGGRL